MKNFNIFAMCFFRQMKNHQATRTFSLSALSSVTLSNSSFLFVKLYKIEERALREESSLYVIVENKKSVSLGVKTLS